MHETVLLETIAVGLAVAFVGGMLVQRMGLPPLLGYLFAGVAVGPFTPGFVADQKIASELAEIGVMLLMFGVGMHFSIRDLWAVRGIALPGAVAQIVAATALGAALGVFWGWPLAGALLFGLALSVASTVVLLRALESTGRLNTEEGRIAVGWLIVEDLVMVLVLVILPALVEAVDPGAASAASDAATDGLLTTLGIALAKIAGFVAFMLIVGRKVFPWILQQVEKTGSRELFTLAVVSLSLGVAFIAAALFDVSFALAAFFAGVVLNESDLSHRAAGDLQPLQDIFAALFFVAVGMLFDPWILVKQPLHVLAVVAIIVIGKSLAAFAIVRVLGYSRETAVTVSAALAQIGEFSFILATMGVALRVLPAEGQSLILAGALISIMLNSFIFRILSRAMRAA